MAKIIAAANRKGGVGKTTTVICLAHSLGRRDRSVLLIDLDPQNALSAALMPPGEKAASGVIDLLRGVVGPTDAVSRTQLVNVDLIPYGSPECLSEEHEGLFGMPEKKRAFSRSLSALSGNYHYILVDSPPGSSAIVQFALFHAQSVIIPLQCQPLALRIVPRILKDIRQLMETANPSLKVEGILLTMYEFWNPISQSVVDQVMSFFPRESVFLSAVIRKSPVFERIFDSENSPLLQEEVPEELLDYDIVAQLIVKKEEQKAASESPTSAPSELL